MTHDGAPPPVADQVLWLATAYQASRALHVAARLGLPDLLADGAPQDAKGLARAAGMHAPSLRRLLRALTAFGVFAEGEDGRFALGPLGALLRDGAPGSLRALVLLHAHADFWQSWGELEACVRSGEPAPKLLHGAEDAFARCAADPELGPVFNAGMTALSAALGAAVLADYDPSRARCIVDVGGGEGRLLADVLRAAPLARGVLLDLPAVVAGAYRILAEAGVAERCEVVGGDMFAAGGVPAGGDLYVLSRVLNSFDDVRAAAILANCRRAMAEHGRLLLIERVLPERMEATPKTRSIALSDLNMLVRTGGRERTEAEFRMLLVAAGLRLARVVRTGTHLSLVEATVMLGASASAEAPELGLGEQGMPGV